MPNFFLKTKNAFGLDISAGSLKIMQLDRRGGSFQVKGFAYASLPKGLVINDAITDQKTFSFLLEQALSRPEFGHIEGRHAVVSLPESKSFVRVIQIPKMSDTEAIEAVPFEAESFIPLPIDQVYLDWQKLGHTEDGKMNILIIAAPKEFVDSYLAILDHARITTIALEVESQSCTRVLFAGSEPETSLIIDLEANRSSLVMIEDGNLQFTSTIPIAGNSFTESIARSLGISSIKAEEIKKKVGIANTAEYPNIKTALLPVLNTLSAEVRNILKFHSGHSQKQVGRIILVGGTAKLANLPEFLAMELGEFSGLKVEIGAYPAIVQSPLNPIDGLGLV